MNIRHCLLMSGGVYSEDISYILLDDLKLAVVNMSSKYRIGSRVYMFMGVL